MARHRSKEMVEIDKSFLPNAAKQLGISISTLGTKIGRSNGWGWYCRQAGRMGIYEKNRIEALLAGHQLPVAVPAKRRSSRVEAPSMPFVAEPSPLRFVVLCHPEDGPKARALFAACGYQFEEVR